MRTFLSFNLIFAFLWVVLSASPGLSEGSGAAQKDEGGSPRKVKVSGAYVFKVPESACSSEGCLALREGKELLDGAKYREAIVRLKFAYRELPVAGDYALFFMAKAFSGMKDFEDARACVDDLLRAYPDSLLKKRVRALQIRNGISESETSAEGVKREDLLKAFESYASDYPEDMDMKFLFAQFLKKRGGKEQAKRLFRQVYVKNCSLSEEAYRQLEYSDVSVEDMLARASNLIRDVEYKKAETLLRKTITIAEGSLRDEAQRKLGTALFRQKRYKESTAEFFKAGDLYGAARSLFRAGELDGFHSALSRLVSMEDQRAGSLWLALASKRRREGETGEALEIYTRVRNAYPSHSEEALWGMAWTFYRKGDYEMALKTLTELSRSHPDPKYLYWKTKSLGNTDEEGVTRAWGPDAESFVDLGNESNGDFYGLLTRIYVNGRKERHSGLIEDTAGSKTSLSTSESFCSQTIPLSSETPLAFVGRQEEDSASSSLLQRNADLARAFERFLILMAIGTKEDAVAELLSKSQEISNPELLLYAGRALKEAGSYRSAIALVSRLAKHQEVRVGSEAAISDILYPLAYWSVVEKATKDHGLDPIILLSVMREESRYDPEVRSAAGAIGLMQIMPQTADTLSRHKVTTADEIYDVKTNITIGAYYLSLLMKEFHSLPVAIAAYNAGEEKVREWLKKGNYRSFDEFIEDIPFDETRNYVKKVLLTYSAYKQKSSPAFSACNGQASP
ncbi:MAG TPA: transglycosylase SLT domain-containing protein [Thermodesulfovibrionales bacterium]|nr:transglycosylase SLT domain-containing protein [Thermodesulfovibrionales bacterium]